MLKKKELTKDELLNTKERPAYIVKPINLLSNKSETLSSDFLNFLKIVDFSPKEPRTLN